MAPENRGKWTSILSLRSQLADKNRKRTRMKVRESLPITYQSQFSLVSAPSFHQFLTLLVRCQERRPAAIISKVIFQNRRRKRNKAVTGSSSSSGMAVKMMCVFLKISFICMQ